MVIIPLAQPNFFTKVVKTLTKQKYAKSDFLELSEHVQ